MFLFGTLQENNYLRSLGINQVFMAEINIKDLLESNSIAKELKEAYSFMLLSRGYSADDIRILDEYDFAISRRGLESDSPNNYNGHGINKPLRDRKKKNLPKSLVCLSSKSEVYNKRDHTLYSFNDSEPLTKGRLVWSIISKYQRDFNPTFEEVSQLYNNKLNLLRNTIIDIASLDALRPDKQKRFYYHNSDFLNSKDGVKYTVSNQWSIDKMNEIISFARSKGWKVDVIIPQQASPSAL